jgi:hypothetical protein
VLERLEDVAAERDDPRHGVRGLAGLAHLAADVDTADVQQAGRSVDVAPLEREPLLRA